MVFILRKGEYERFHAMQSILFWLAVIVVSIVIDIAGAIFDIIPVIGAIVLPILGIIKLLFGLAVLILWLVLMWKAFVGEKLELPMLSEQSRKMKGQASKSV